MAVFTHQLFNEIIGGKKIPNLFWYLSKGSCLLSAMLKQDVFSPNLCTVYAMYMYLYITQLDDSKGNLIKAIFG